MHDKEEDKAHVMLGLPEACMPCKTVRIATSEPELHVHTLSSQLITWEQHIPSPAIRAAAMSGSSCPSFNLKKYSTILPSFQYILGH